MTTTSPLALPRSALGWAAMTVLSVAFGLVAYALTTHALSQPVGVDAAGYYAAAERLRDGQPLYADVAVNASDRYRYAPWFAAAWIPFTFLDRDLVLAAWVGLMILAAAASTIPLLFRGLAGIALFAVLAPLQLQGAVYGNVQPLLVLALVWGAGRRSGPAWVAAAASLKAVPILLAIVYAGRGQWLRAATTVVLTALLVGPMLLFDLSGYSVEAGPNQMSLAAVWFPVYVGLAIAGAIVTFLAARTRYAFLVASVAMLAALPRLLTYELGFLLVGLVRNAGSDGTRPIGSR